MRKSLHIAVGVLTNSAGEVLIAQRQAGQAGAGEWEFPGGKRHPGESVRQALARELDEELGVTVRQCTPLIRIRHTYPDRSVLLDTWWVDDYACVPRGVEGQATAWVQTEALPHAGLLAADAPIANAIRLPAKYAICPPDATDTALLAWLAAPKARLLRVRRPAVADAAYWQAWPALADAARASDTVLLADRLPSAGQGGDLSVHISAARAAELQRRPSGLTWFGVSCHTPSALRHAAAIGADFAVLGQVKTTPSHPGRKPLGWAHWQRWADAAQLPVYAIGGLREDDVAVARTHGGQGVAAIRDFW